MVSSDHCRAVGCRIWEEVMVALINKCGHVTAVTEGHPAGAQNHWETGQTAMATTPGGGAESNACP